MSPSPIETPRTVLRPKARLLHTIGSELISSESVALVELVKNAYDADARRVLLRFKNPTADHGCLNVLDDGTGMSSEVVRGTWLDIATPFRAGERTSPKGRKVLGEKGIGRFAAARLANELDMVSRTAASSYETRVRVDWRQFRDPERFLDEVELDVSQQLPASFAPGGTAYELWESADLPTADQGTLLNLIGVTSHWTEETLTDLRRDLSRLIRPATTAAPTDFQIHLELPEEFGALSGPIEPPTELANAPYLLIADVKADGVASATVRLPDREEVSLTFEVDSAHRHRNSSGLLHCGPFAVELRVFDRDREGLQRLEASAGLPFDARNFRALLDHVAGISLYRDGFRVLPFGERGDDWLGLDARRVNNPTQNISNSQVIGTVAITSADNAQLRDQSNREGLMEGVAYKALQATVMDAVLLLEVQRFSQRRGSGEGHRAQARGRSLFSAFNLSDVTDAVQRTPNPDPALVALVERADLRVTEGVDRVRDVLARYQRLATLGKLVDGIVHDGQSSVGRIRRATRDANRLLAKNACADPKTATNLVEAVDQQGEYLGTLFRRIAPFGGRRRGRPREVSAQEVVLQAVDVLATTAKRADVEVLVMGENPRVTVDPAEMQELVINLLDNALYWARQRKQENRRVEIRIDQPQPATLTVTVDDNGPGVPESLREAIFDPYFSSKPDGSGLGLSIVGELVADAYDGTLALVESRLGGAAFELTFNRRVG